MHQLFTLTKIWTVLWKHQWAAHCYNE